MKAKIWQVFLSTWSVQLYESKQFLNEHLLVYWDET